MHVANAQREKMNAILLQYNQKKMNVAYDNQWEWHAMTRRLMLEFNHLHH